MNGIQVYAQDQGISLRSLTIRRHAVADSKVC